MRASPPTKKTRARACTVATPLSALCRELETDLKASGCRLNAPEEVELAELMLELHPWSKGGMVRYARGGGEIDM